MNREATLLNTRGGQGLPVAGAARTRAYNPIGSGTRNFPVNVPVDWLAAVKEAACAAGVSAGQYFRQLVERGAQLENPALAERLGSIRRQYYGPVARAGHLMVLLAVVVHGWLCPEELLRRRCGRAALGGSRAFCQMRSTRQGQGAVAA